MNIFTALRESHDLQRALCRRLVTKQLVQAAREATFLQLAVELAAHAAAEERFLYAPLLMVDAGLSASRHALAEHHEAEELVEALKVRDKTGAAWLKQARELGTCVRHHLDEEEQGFFQLAGRLLTATQKARLAKRYLADVARMRKMLG
jgi:hypothetical protein